MSRCAVVRGGSRLYPMPEAFPGEAGRGWDIQEAPAGLGSGNLLTRQMFAPLGGSRHDHVVRCHEVGHAWLSAGSPEALAARWGVGVETLQAVEDNRINGSLVKLAGIDLSAGSAPASELEASARRVALGGRP